MDKTDHPYAQVNALKEGKVDYESEQIVWGATENYGIISKLGRGKYSHVFLGNDHVHKRKVAIKVLLPIHKEKIIREHYFLKTLSHPNIIKLFDIVKSPQLRTASFVMEYFEHVDFRELYPKLTLPDIKHYMKELLTTLDYLHSRGVMHRDVKPFNILINPKTKKLKLIDLGLSELYYPDNQNSVSIGALYYKAPEVFFSNGLYDYRVDCWSAGMVMASMISKKIPFLMGNEVIDQILKISKLVGTREVVQYIRDYKLTDKRGHHPDNICFDMLIAFEKRDIKESPPSNFSEFIDEANKQNFTTEAISLLRGLLTLDFRSRLTASEALKHPFFAA